MGYTEMFLEASNTTKIIILVIIILNTALLLGSLRAKQFLAGIGISIVMSAVIYFLIERLSGIDIKTFVIIYLLPSYLLSLAFISIGKILNTSIGNGKQKISEVIIRGKKGKSVKIDTIKGVSIQGAPGSGKTLSAAGWIMQDFGKRNIPGLAYDYKNLELTEMLMWFYKDSDIDVNVFHPSDPERSCNINCFDPKYLNKREDFMILAKTLTDNLLADTGGNDNFFKTAAEGAISGVLIRLKEDFPQYCSFPYLTAIFLQKNADELVEFIEKNENSKRQAASFLDSAGSDRQMAAVKGSLSNAFRNFDIPNLFYTTMNNDFELDINNDKNQALTILVNVPNYDEVYQPILAVTAQAIILQMSKRDRNFAYLLFDEAPTLKLQRMPRIPSTMRSFNIATIYMLQDKIQAANQLGTGVMKEILANLSTLFFGKTNDPETAKFFESYFDQVKVKQKSYSKKEGMFFEREDARVNVSEREEKKHKSHEMFKRKAGEFFIIDDKGANHNIAILPPKVESKPYERVRSVSERDLESNYRSILSIAKRL